jgi:heme/copper-type cytochrome/quinol oxidase subunit 2
VNSAVALIACATCFGAPDSSMTQGMNMAIFTLLGVTGVVLGGFIWMIVYLVRRARRYQATEEIISQIPKGLPEVG